MPQSATLGKDSSPNLNPISSSFQIGEMHESLKAAGKERKASCLHWFAMYITVVTPPRHRPCQEPKETFPSLSWRNLLLTSPPRYPHLLNGFSCHSGIHSNGSDLKSLLRSDLFPLVPITLPESEEWSCGHAFGEYCLFEDAATGRKGRCLRVLILIVGSLLLIRLVKLNEWSLLCLWLESQTLACCLFFCFGYGQ